MQHSEIFRIDNIDYSFVRELSFSNQVVLRDSTGKKHKFYINEVEGYKRKKKPKKVKLVNSKRRKKTFKKNFISEDRVVFIKNLPCVVCGASPCDNADIVSRGSGRSSPYTIIPLCRPHHIELDTQLGRNRFSEKYNLDLLQLAEETQNEYIKSTQ